MDEKNENDERLSGQMFNNEETPDEQKSKNKNIIFIIMVILFLLILGILLVLFISTNNDNENNNNNEDNNDEKKDDEEVNPIPKNEDLDFTEEEHRLLSRKVASETMVLATNNGGLPLLKTDQVVLFGQGTNNTIYGGWGSGEVYNKGTDENMSPVTILQGIENKTDCFIYVENNIGYEIGIPGFSENKNLTDEDIKDLSEKRDGADRRIAILTISRRSGEGSDRPQDSSNAGTLLSDSEIDTYNSIIKYFDKVVIILNVGSVIELNDIEKNEKTTILISWLPGMEAGNAIADVLVGDVNPSGHLTDTWAKTINDYPTTSTFLESPMYVKYKEGLFVGYRYFEEDEEKQKKVIFPFGHGLSYTTFKLENNCEFNKEQKIFTITSKVTNTGEKSGKQVVQVYVKKPQNEKFVKVQRELIAFNKTKELEPGESQTLTLKFDLYYLASYDDTGVTGNKACYVLEEGDYLIYVGNSVSDTRNENSLLYTHKQDKLIVTQKLNNRLVPHDPDVANANTKPDFRKLFFDNKKNNNNKEIVNDEKIILKQENEIQINENEEKNQYSNLPTDVFNEINFKSVLEKKHKMEELVDLLSNEELAFLSYGKPGTIRHGTGIIGGFYNSGPTAKYNIPYGDTNDGPAGLRQSEISMASTAWPCSTALASSFDLDLIKKVGEETGKEARKLGCSFWLAPGMNIHRSPLCGRNFEYYSEDPFLTGKMASAITKGLQSKRVSITLKHFAVNNKEYNRNGDEDKISKLASDSRMAERVAREIYLKGFEIAVKEGKPWSIMTSYNRINSMKTAESYDLLTGILRDEWKYDGLVMTDWGTKSKNDREAHAGGTVKMPNNNDGTKTILDGIIEGSVTREDLKRNILYMFNTLAKTACIDALFNKPKNIIKITKEKIHINIMNSLYRKYSGISYEKCKDPDEEGYNPTKTTTNSWISLYIENNEEQYREVRIRYSSILEGFGIAFKKYNENLGEITNLEKTGDDWQIWKTSSNTTVKFPKGSYELTVRFLGYDYASEDNNKGIINWIEIL
jgi:beta-glucosidase